MRFSRESVIVTAKPILPLDKFHTVNKIFSNIVKKIANKICDSQGNQHEKLLPYGKNKIISQGQKKRRYKILLLCVLKNSVWWVFIKINLFQAVLRKKIQHTGNFPKNLKWNLPDFNKISRKTVGGTFRIFWYCY